MYGTSEPPSSWLPATPRIPHHKTLLEYARLCRQTLAEFGQAHRAGDAATFQDWQFRRDKPQRAAILAALDGIPQLANARQRLLACGSKVHLYKHLPSGLHVIRRWRCGERWCPCCARAQLRRQRTYILSKIPTPQRGLSFLTLTHRAHPGESIGTAFSRIHKAFRKLRLAPFWKQAVLGGVAVTEVTYNAEEHWYNAHVHCVLDTTWMDLTDLQAAWTAIHGEWSNLHLEACADNNRISHYLSKYLAKPLPPEIYADPDRLRSAILSYRGRHTLAFFGGWHGLALTKQADAESKRQLDAAQIDPKEWCWVGELNTLVQEATQGDPQAQATLLAAGFGAVQLSLVQVSHPSPQRAPPRQLYLCPAA